MTGTPPKPDVPKGPATITGYGAAAVAFVAMFLAYVFPDGDEQTLGVVAAGAVGLASLLWTNYGRQKQAVAQIKAQAPVAPVPNPIDVEEAKQAERSAAAALGLAATLVARTAMKDPPPSEPEEPVLSAATEGLDPEYQGRDGTTETRLTFEQREACS